jgi:hypothetical protein
MAMDHIAWKALREVETRRLSEGRLQAHYAIQWLARVARAYIPSQPDDSHTSLRWDHDLDGFTTRALPDHTRLCLQLTNLTLTLHGGNSSAAEQSFSLDGRTDLEVRQWLGTHIDMRGHDMKALDAPSPYEVPHHAIARGARYDAAGSADALAMIAACFANAEILLDDVRRQMIERKLSASQVCCWPHHFDLATLAMVPTQEPGMDGFVGAGLSPGDEYYNEPYFYVSVYPEPQPEALPALPALGHWHRHEFTAAILPAHRILAAADQVSATGDFLQHAVAIALNILG